MNIHELEQQPDIKRLVENPLRTRAEVPIEHLPDGVICISHVDGHDALGMWTVLSERHPRYEMRCPFGFKGFRLVFDGVRFEVVRVRPKRVDADSWVWAGEFKRI